MGMALPREKPLRDERSLAPSMLPASRMNCCADPARALQLLAHNPRLGDTGTSRHLLEPRSKVRIETNGDRVTHAPTL
jgi:hypothetical protein